MHFSSCKSINTEAIHSPPSPNSLNCWQFMSHKRIDFPSSLPHRVRGRCFDSVLGTRWGFLGAQGARQPPCQPQSAHLLLRGPRWSPSTVLACFSNCSPVLQVAGFSAGTTGLPVLLWCPLSGLPIPPCLQQCAVPLGSWQPAAVYPARWPLFTCASDRLSPLFPQQTPQVTNQRLVLVWATGTMSLSTDALSIWMCLYECIQTTSMSPDGSGKILLLSQASGLSY